MTTELRETGISVLGNIAWGTHFCHFYETKEDLLDILVPYFRAGLENNEFCMWVAHDPLGVDEALDAFRRAFPEGDRHLSSGSMKIVQHPFPHLRQQASPADSVETGPHTKWYLKDGVFDAESVIDAWREKLDEALAQGYAGMRINGNEAWMTKEHWENLGRYERALDEALAGRRMILLCSYPLAGAGAAQILDVVRTHQFAVVRRGRDWEVVETPELKQAKAEIKRLNEELERRVVERTRELEAANEKLRGEIVERKRAGEALRVSEQNFRTAFYSNPSPAVIVRIRDRQWLNVNSAFERTFGHKAKEAISKTGAALGIWADTREREELWQRFLLNKKAINGYETRLITKSGALVDVLLYVQYIELSGEECFLASITDITERKRAEEALRESENLWRTVFDNAAIGIGLVNSEGRPIETNPALQRMLGYTKEELSRLWFVDFTHPDDVPRELALHKEVVEGKRDHYQLEKRYIRKDGQVRWVNLTASVIPAEHAREAFGVGMVEDITERKLAEEALRESQQLLQLVLATLPVGVVVIDRAGDIILVNAASKRLWGDIIVSGRQRWAQTSGFWHNSGERIAPTAWASVRALSEGRTSLNELIDIETYDGRRKTIENSAAPIRNAEGLIVGAVVVNEDVTERVRAEEALRETHSKLELLLDTSPLPITSVDASGRITSWNKAAERLFGWSAEEAVERVCPTIPPEETGEYLELIRRVMRGETYVGLVRYRQKMDGGLLRCSVSVAPQRNGRGEPVGATLIVEDITERVRAEEQLKRTNEELRALSARLHSVREEEGARIAREIHDELGGALSILKWDMEEIGEIISEPAGAPQLTALREKVGGMITLTDATVDAVRRIASELRPTALEEFGLVEALRWHAQEFQARTGITVACDCPAESAELTREQATAVFRIVQEALTNVLRHSRATRVEIKIRHEGEHYVMTVSDDGRGITESEKTGPRSLGLLGMRERAHLLGGEISVEGAEGRGTVVTLRVPALDYDSG